MKTLSPTNTPDVVRLDFETGTYITYPGDRQQVDELRVIAGTKAEITDEVEELDDGIQTKSLVTVGTTNLNYDQYHIFEPLRRTPNEKKFGIGTAAGSVGRIQEIRPITDFATDYQWARERVSPYVSYRSLLFTGRAEDLFAQMHDADLPPTSPVVVLTAMAVYIARVNQ